MRDLTAAALAKLYLDDKPAAVALLRRMFALQCLDETSPAFGTVPWQEERPDLRDENAVDFTMLPFAQVMRRFGERLPPDFKREALPHLRAAIAEVRARNADIRYTNIYLMQAACLLLLGEAADDAAAIHESRRQLEAWIDLTRTAGVAEYVSPTYTPVQIGCLEAAYNTASDPDMKRLLKGCLDYLWSGIAANYFPGRRSVSGPQSRVYDWLYGDENINYLYYLAGLRREPPGEILLSDLVRIWTNAVTPGGYRPDPGILALADLPERIVQDRFGTEPGQDLYNDITPGFALGSASGFHDPQDKQICLDFATAKNLPSVEVVADASAAPYGRQRVSEAGGHPKPRHLKDHIAAVQDHGTVLALLDLSPGVAGTEQDSVATNLIFPVRADAIFLDGKSVVADRAFERVIDKTAVVVVREGATAAVLRLFSADGVAGQAARFVLGYDGNEWGAGRLVAYHYRGPRTTVPAGPIHAGIFIHAERFDSEEAFQDLLRRSRDWRFDERHDGGAWSVTVRGGTVRLEAAFDERQHIALRRVDGRDVAPHGLTVNGRDLAAECLDPLRPAPVSR